MKRIAFKSIILLAILMMVAVTAFAFSSVQGSVIDSKNSAPWTHGGEVWVYDTGTGDICGTGTLDATGHFSISLDGSQDTLGAGGGSRLPDCTTGHNNHTLEILIDFTCAMGVGTCDAPNGTPATNSKQFTQNGIPVPYNAGYISTGTGPTAIRLDAFSAQSGMQWNLVAAGGLLVLAAGGFAIARRKQWL